MDNLWKKETTQVGKAQYVDLFNSMQKDDLLYKLIQNLNLAKCNKDSQISTSLRVRGNELFRTGNWTGAMKCYNESLCFAEVGSECVALAYSNRSACFFHMGMYDEALIDIELARNANVPSNLIEKLEERKQQCVAQISEMKHPSKYVPKLSYETDKNYPGLANVVEIKHNSEFGRHLVATTDIPVGQTVLMEEIFMKTRDNEKRYACHTCFHTETNFIACVQCTAVMFCNTNCMHRNQTHKWECGRYITLSKHHVRFHIQLILLVVEIFKDAKSLIDFVEHVLHEDRDKLPSTLHDLQSKYHFFLKLETSAPCYKDVLHEALKIYTIIMKIPKIRALFNSDDEQCFLKHLIVHHWLIGNTNATGDEESLSVTNILSLLNHSCAPNVCHSFSGGLRYCETVRPIKKGEQLFISYLGIKKDPSAKVRQSKLKRLWDFVCKCDRCHPTITVHPCSPFYIVDPCFRFVRENCENDDKFAATLENCRQFLDKYGQFWSDEVQFVSHNYSYMLAERSWKRYK